MLLANLLLVIFFVKDPDVVAQAEKGGDVLQALTESFKSFVKELYVSFLRSGSGPKLGLIFSVLPIGALALAYATLGTLKVDYGSTDMQNAELSVYNTVTAGVGCLIGGFLGDRFGIKKMLWLFYALTTVPTVYLGLQIATIGLESIPLAEFYGVIVGHGAVYGMTFGLHAAIFMGMTNPAVAATQFTAFMAMSNLAISIGSYWQGIVAERVDYAMVLYLDSVLVIIRLLLIPCVRNGEAPSQIGPSLGVAGEPAA
ncbi:MAG: hypothetical protein OER85_19870 [Gammaproteobacteria bacterium]|nr:hypothetical protein [Gammaproteobacteria bacterium]